MVTNYTKMQVSKIFEIYICDVVKIHATLLVHSTARSSGGSQKQHFEVVMWITDVSR